MLFNQTSGDIRQLEYQRMALHHDCTRYSVLAVLGSLFVQALAVVEHFENFDPERANPRKSITCLGDKSSINFPEPDWFGILGFVLESMSMQKLCAKPQYEGGPPYMQLGGWCFRLDDPRGDREVVFDILHPAAKSLP